MEALLAAKGYAQATQSTATPKGVEYNAFSRVTRDLARTKTLSKIEFPKLAEALHTNNRLWTIIAGDVATDGNGLPQALRSQLFYLAEFTLQHSKKVLNGDASVDILIEINTSIMKGLRSALKVKGEAS